MGTKSPPTKRNNGLQDRIAELNSKLERVDVMTHRKRKTYHLDDMLAQITPENRHPEWDTGPSQGSEEW